MRHVMFQYDSIFKHPAWLRSGLSKKNIQSKSNTLRHVQVNRNIANYDQANAIVLFSECLGRDEEKLGRQGGRYVWRGSGWGRLNMGRGVEHRGWISEGVDGEGGICWRKANGEGGIWEGKWTGTEEYFEHRWKWRDEYGDVKWVGVGEIHVGRRGGRGRDGEMRESEVNGDGREKCGEERWTETEEYVEWR